MCCFDVTMMTRELLAQRKIPKDVGFLGGAVGGIEDHDAIARHAKAFHHVHLHVETLR